MEPLYRLWVFEQVKAHGSIRKEDALSGGAEYLQLVIGRGSPFTLERYLRKLVSCVGSFREYRSARGGLEYGFRPGVDVEALGDRLHREAKFMALSEASDESLQTGRARARARQRSSNPSGACDESFPTNHAHAHERGDSPVPTHAILNTHWHGHAEGHTQGRDRSFENSPACAREGGVGNSRSYAKNEPTNREGGHHAE